MTAPERSVFSKLAVPRCGALLSTSFSDSRILAARFRSDNPHGLESRVPAGDGFVFMTRLRDFRFADPEVEARQTCSAINIINLKKGPSCPKKRPFDDLYLHIPQSALDRIAEEANASRILELRTPDGWETTDPVVRQVRGLIVEAIEHPDAASQLFVDHILMALLAHLARTYGGLCEGTRRRAGGLAPWQESRAREMIATNVVKSLSIDEIARECGLSASHFTRAFKQSTGMTPHDWLQECRVEQAKALLADQDRTLAAIAVACGFADQSHFTRVFNRRTGSTPGFWRRHSGNA